MKIEVLDCYTQGMQILSFNFAQLVYYILHLLGFMGGFFIMVFTFCCYLYMNSAQSLLWYF